MSGIIKERVTYHAPSEAQKAFYEKQRKKFTDLMGHLEAELVDSREKSIAMTKIEECMFWANACVARNMKDL